MDMFKIQCIVFCHLWTLTPLLWTLTPKPCHRRCFWDRDIAVFQINFKMPVEHVCSQYKRCRGE